MNMRVPYYLHKIMHDIAVAIESAVYQVDPLLDFGVVLCMCIPFYL